MRNWWVGLLLIVGACECDPEGTDPPAGDGGADGAAEASVDAPICVEENRCGAAQLCCSDGEECVDDSLCDTVCENVRCGDNNLTCCAAGQVCVDGVVCGANCQADETLCGAALELCCSAGDVCLDDACVTPGDACADDFDCLTEGDYCEETVGRCLQIPNVDPVCELLPDFEQVELAVEWNWTGEMVDGLLYQHVAATPVVGDISGDGIPDVVVPAYSSGGNAALVAVNGNDGTTLWAIAGADRPDWIGVAALADFDPTDAALEVVYPLDSNGIRIVDGDGTTELARRTTGGVAVTRSAPAIADINADGVPDVVVGCHAMNGTDISDAALDFFDGGRCTTSSQSFASAAIADLDGDGLIEVTTGGVALQVGATPADEVLWTRSSTPHGLPAVADLNVDGLPEVVNIRSGQIEVLNGQDGTVLLGPGGAWQDATFSIPGGGNGGAPTIADFDGDGLPEVATAGRGAYVVYDPDCLVTPPRMGGDCAPGTTDFVRWQAPTQDISSSITGSSVFDFQGDGVAEVVYNDECFLHIYDGRDGNEILVMPRANSSRTALEYPLVVDVDRDGNSEIVLPANADQIDRDNCPEAWSAAFGVPIAMLPAEFRDGTRGIFAFGDPRDRWVRTRPIWNQFTYHVTNVTDLGAVPMTEVDNWTVSGLNNYRQNVQGAGVFNAPNLAVELEAVAACASREIRLSALVQNIGSRGVAAGVLVEFFQTSPSPEVMVGQAMTTQALLPGASERVTVTVSSVPADTDLTYEVRVDGAASATPVAECNEDDNLAQASERCAGLL
ncbi:MAG: VCBS repeat-containing protein [Myxococcota bacterium]